MNKNDIWLIAGLGNPETKYDGTRDVYKRQFPRCAVRHQELRMEQLHLFVRQAFPQQLRDCLLYTSIQPPQSAAALPCKSAFHCAMQFLRCRQRSHGAAAGGI